MNSENIRRHLSFFLVGLSLFMFEIGLTRLFSALLVYHFVFIAIAMAMLGWAGGGFLAYRWLKEQDPQKPKYKRQFENKKGQLLILLSLSLLITIVLLYKIPFTMYLVVAYILLSALPFILGGFYLSLVFSDNPRQSGSLYFADLLGSAAGSFLIIILLNNYSLIRIGLMMSLIILLVAALNQSSRKRLLLGSVLTVAALVAIVAAGSFLDAWAADFGAYKGNPKTLGTMDGKPRIVFSSWNSLARTDVVETDAKSVKSVLVDGGAVSSMIPFDGNLAKVSSLTKDVGFFAFAAGPKKSALLIGPGGGKDLLLAHLAGIHDITAVEINPGTIEAARYFEKFNGNIYGQEGTRVFIEDGRNFITRDTNKYDIIYLSMVMTQASEALGYALSENYIYTKEAYQSYLDRLTPEGTLAFVLHGQNDLSKALVTLFKVLEERGIPGEEIPQYLAVVNSAHREGRSMSHNMVMYPLLMLKKSPFTTAESIKLQQLAENAGQPIIHLPQVKENPAITPPPEVRTKLLVTDDYPFFYNPGKGAPQPILLILAAVFMLGYILFASWFQDKSPQTIYMRRYFSLIGAAFMLIEIPLLQKLILLLGHPTLTFSTVIAILLFSAGLGSLSSRFLSKKLSLKVIGALIFLYTLLLYLLLPQFIAYFQGYALWLKISAIFALLLPLGILMGIPFPTGIRWIEAQGKDNLIPIAWGINGWMSVIGSTLSLVLAMTLGYNLTLLTGAFLYLVFAFHTGKPVSESVN